MSESHAADSLLDEERAKREAEEFKARLKAASELVERLSLAKTRHLHVTGVPLDLLTVQEAELLVWYIRKLQAGHREVHHMLFNHINEMQNARRTICPLY